MNLQRSALLFCFSSFFAALSMEQNPSMKKTSDVHLKYPWIKKDGVWVVDPKSATVYISSPDHSRLLRPGTINLTQSPPSTR